MSGETKFTPGPWIPRAENSPVIVEGRDPGHVIATVAPKKGHANHQSEFGMFGSIPRLRLSSEERTANAALIAAAPMMYDFINIARKFLPYGIAMLADVVMMRARGEHLEEQDEDSDQQ